MDKESLYEVFDRVFDDYAGLMRGDGDDLMPCLVSCMERELGRELNLDEESFLSYCYETQEFVSHDIVAFEEAVELWDGDRA